MIKIKDLTFRYHGAKYNAIDNLSISIPENKYVAILGHNGSGKSTLSKLLVGLYKPLKSEIEIDKVKIEKKTLIEIRKKIGIIFQNPDNQFIGSTVEDDIAFGLENRRFPPEKMGEKIIEFATKVNMEKYLEREPNFLSGGQKQRVAIASILALDPKVIIFDEVTSMLDPKGKREVLNIIKKIQQKRNKTLISITHDMDEAIQADFCLVMAKGKVVASGNPKEILSNKEIIKSSKIDSPFIYKLSEQIEGITPTYDEDELLESLWK